MMLCLKKKNVDKEDGELRSKEKKRENIKDDGVTIKIKASPDSRPQGLSLQRWGPWTRRRLRRRQFNRRQCSYHSSRLLQTSLSSFVHMFILTNLRSYLMSLDLFVTSMI